MRVSFPLGGLLKAASSLHALRHRGQRRKWKRGIRRLDVSRKPTSREWLLFHVVSDLLNRSFKGNSLTLFPMFCHFWKFEHQMFTKRILSEGSMAALATQCLVRDLEGFEKLGESMFFKNSLCFLPANLPKCFMMPMFIVLPLIYFSFGGD